MDDPTTLQKIWSEALVSVQNYDWASLWAALLRNSLPLEVIGLVLGSALIGFLIARWMYRGAMLDRNEQLRRESAIWRRKLANGRNTQVSLLRQRDRVARQLRRQTPPAKSAA